MHPKYLSINDFTYNLPEEKIAVYPLAKRDESKLLVYKNGNITENTYEHLDKHIPANSLMIFNNTKVIEARLVFHKPSGSTIEVFCLEPDERYGDFTIAFQQKQKVLWKCLVGGVKKWKEEYLSKNIEINEQRIELKVKQVEKRNAYILIQFEWNNPGISFIELLHYFGQLPLPPYLNRDADESDHNHYQTVYAQHDGSVAAPTAGLHFTPALLEKLEEKSIAEDYVTLHVGAGTFMPVKSANMEGHIMHAELIDVHKSVIENILNHLDENIIAIGTTSLRTIESLYWLGVKAKNNFLKESEHQTIGLAQWEPYELPNDMPVQEALTALLLWLDMQKTDTLVTKTQIIIAPGYSLKIADAIITFHCR